MDIKDKNANKNGIATVADMVRDMPNDTLAIYLHSWQTENMSIEEIKDLLGSDASVYNEK
jgi:hypothetical protein